MIDLFRILPLRLAKDTLFIPKYLLFLKKGINFSVDAYIPSRNLGCGALCNGWNRRCCQASDGSGRSLRCSGGYDGLIDSMTTTDMGEGFAGSQLVALLLAVSGAFACLHTADNHRTAKNRTVGMRSLVEERKLNGIAALLAPLDDGTLVIGFPTSHLLNPYVLPQHALLDETVAHRKATIEINGTHKSLEGIAGDKTIVRLLKCRGVNERLKPHLVCHMAQGGTLHHSATCHGEEPLTAIRITTIEDVSTDGT